MNSLETKIRGIKAIAKIHKWDLLCYQANIGMISFTNLDENKNRMRINIYTTKMTVATSLNHPKQGKTQLFRRHVTPPELNEIFKNPRVHTDKGYKTK